MNFKTPLLGVAAAAIAVSAATIAPSSAQALSLSGDINLQGVATVPDYTSVGETQNVTFSAPTIVKGSLNGSSITSGGITINPLALTLTNQSPVPLFPDLLFRTFKNSGLNPFIDFGSRTIGAVTSNLTFNLLASNTYVGTKTISNGLLSLFDSGVLSGNFQFDGATIANGTVSANRSGETVSNGIYGITLTAQPIPTPALLPGLVGLGMGVLRKRKKAAAEAVGAEA